MNLAYSSFAVDGNFGPWSAWSVCTTTCGGGAMSRFRNCTDPLPMHGGKGCERIGAAFDIKSCGDNYCPGMFFSAAHISKTFQQCRYYHS